MEKTASPPLVIVYNATTAAEMLTTCLQFQPVMVEMPHNRDYYNCRLLRVGQKGENSCIVVL